MKKILYTRFFYLFGILSFAISAQAQNVVKVQPGTFISSRNNAIITLMDMDFDNDGIFNLGAGQGTVVFNGTSNNTISGTSSPLFDILQIAKTGGGGIALQRGIRVGSQIQFGGGVIDLNSQNILLGPGAFLNGESPTSYITGIKGGYVQIVASSLNAPTDAKPGNLGILITSGQNLGSVIIRRGHQSQTNAVGKGASIFRYYDIIPDNNIALNAKLHFSYQDNELNGFTENLLTLWRSSDNTHWTDLGSSLRDATTNFVEESSIESFSRFTLTEFNNPLPLKWDSFNTQCISGQTQINWQTLQEQNTTAFVIRRSTNGSNWATIASLPAAGNSQSALSYSFTDPQSSGSNYYYQVYEEDFDGRKTYSPVLVSQCSKLEGISVYPIPALNNCWISIQSQRSGPVSMKLYNNAGALLRQQVFNLQAGNNVYELSLIPYAKGIYSLVFTEKDGAVKVIKVEKI